MIKRNKKKTVWIIGSICFFTVALVMTVILISGGKDTENSETKVYCDIKTSKFLDFSTTDVITNSVNGYEIYQDESSIEELSEISESENHTVDEYNYQSVRVLNDEGYEELEKFIFYKKNEGERAWTVDIYNIIISDYEINDDMIIIYGCEDHSSESEFYGGRIIMVNINGEVLWDNTVHNGYEKNEDIKKILFDDDNIMVFSIGDDTELCISRYDKNGELLDIKKHEIGDYGICNAIKLGEGYLLHLVGFSDTEEMLVKINSDGTLAEGFTYESADVDYYINEIIEFNGNIVVSANAVISDSLAVDKIDFDLSDEECTRLVRDNYSALLLICNSQTGEPKEFYRVKGSQGADLSVEDGKLIWNVENIDYAYFLPHISSFTIREESWMYKYTFDESIKLENQEKIEKVLSCIH